VAKKKGPVLYELLRKDHAEKRWPNQGEPSQEAPAVVKPQEPPAGDSASQPPTSRMDAPQEDGETLVFHLTRTHAAIAVGGIIVALLVFAWIGSRAGKTAGPSGPSQPSGQTADATGKAADGESQQPLAMLLPEPGGEPKPEQPVRVSPAGEIAPGARASDDAEPAEAASAAGPVAVAKGDSRKPGLNYLVIQIIPERPDTEEHATAVRKFLAEKGIKTIAVPGANGGIKVLSGQGFNFEDPKEKTELDKLTEAVKKAGKEYATAKYAGRYDFRAPYAEKYKGK